MKQPDTAALRERLANYTPEDELEQDKQASGSQLPANRASQSAERSQCAQRRIARHTRQFEAYRPTGADSF